MGIKNLYLLFINLNLKISISNSLSLLLLFYFLCAFPSHPTIFYYQTSDLTQHLNCQKKYILPSSSKNTLFSFIFSSSLAFYTKIMKNKIPPPKKKKKKKKKK